MRKKAIPRKMSFVLEGQCDYSKKPIIRKRSMVKAQFAIRKRQISKKLLLNLAF